MRRQLGTEDGLRSRLEILRSHIETIPADNSGTQETAVRDVEVEAATYDGGMGLLREQLRDGERLITVRVSEG
ncbi:MULTISPECIES: hypothetical protein [unclassified Isoptericola]|uniref:hypothetical protein n=1 Tax=unclassified Isoptericola TaxID=2623355 RepID=UPI00365F41FF